MLRIAIPLTALFWSMAAYADDDEILAAGKAAVAAKLINPDSARFVGARLINHDGQQIICGHVTARGPVRAYTTTNRSFLYSIKKTHVTLPLSTVAVPLPTIVLATSLSQQSSLKFAVAERARALSITRPAKRSGCGSFHRHNAVNTQINRFPHTWRATNKKTPEGGLCTRDCAVIYI
jgi:hypothetical protein